MPCRIKSCHCCVVKPPDTVQQFFKPADYSAGFFACQLGDWCLAGLLFEYVAGALIEAKHIAQIG